MLKLALGVEACERTEHESIVLLLSPHVGTTSDLPSGLHSRLCVNAAGRHGALLFYGYLF
jgi:hypothetical protein